MTRFVVTAGFKSQKILQPVVGYGVSGDDTVQILAPAEDTPPAPREQAVDDAKEMLRMVGGEDISIEVIEINCSSFTAAIFDCLWTLRTADSSAPPVVCLAGGVTDLVFPLVLATTMLWPQGVEALRYYSELQSTGHDCTFPNLVTSIPGRAVDTYDAIVDDTGYWDTGDEAEQLEIEDYIALPILGDRIDRTPPKNIRTTTINAVADATEQSPATVSRHAGALADADFIAIYRGSERNLLCPTVSGLLRIQP